VARGLQVARRLACEARHWVGGQVKHPPFCFQAWTVYYFLGVLQPPDFHWLKLTGEGGLLPCCH
jgi:hypothetical protein